VVKAYKDKKWLYENYVVKEKSVSRIAEECNVSNVTIIYWLDRFGMKRRLPGELPKYKITRELLLREYVQKQKSIERIASEQGVSCDTIRRRLIKYGILRREPNEKSKQHPKLEATPSLSYILGVLGSDGFISSHDRFGLEVKDKEFALEFAQAVRAINLRPYIREINRRTKSLQRQ